MDMTVKRIHTIEIKRTGSRYAQETASADRSVIYICVIRT